MFKLYHSDENNDYYETYYYESLDEDVGHGYICNASDGWTSSRWGDASERQLFVATEQKRIKLVTDLSTVPKYVLDEFFIDTPSKIFGYKAMIKRELNG